MTWLASVMLLLSLLVPSAAAPAAPSTASPAPTKDAASAASSPAAAAAPVALRVYNSDIHEEADTDLGGTPAVSLVATRNAAASGKVVVVGPAPLTGLKATLSDLKQGEAVISRTSLLVRYGQPWETTIGSHFRPKGYDILLEAPPPEFATGKATAWVTVEVPRDARPGAYAGTLKIEVAGGGPFLVPVSLQVGDWTLPDSQEWRTWIEILQSPDNLVAEYKLTPWSDQHWAMIGSSLRLIGRTGSRSIYIPLICHANLGNEESMVRWIRKGDKYEYDFAIVEKYLDTVQQQMGKPKLLTLWAWDVYLYPPSDAQMAKMREKVGEDGGDMPMMKARVAKRGMGPPVTVFDPATGKGEMVHLPPYETAEGKALWQPLWSELRTRLEKRGLWDVAMIGVASDWWPTKEQTLALHELSGGLPWASSQHHTGWLPKQSKSGKGALFETGFIKYVNAVCEFAVTINPAKERTYGWKNAILNPVYWRGQRWNSYSLASVRHLPECTITGTERGLGHIGGDFWYSIKEARGRRVTNVGSRYPESFWHNQNVEAWLLAPGPAGPVGTARLEVLREGVQACEARIAIETVLTDPALKARLGDALAQKAQDFLDDQQRNAWRARGAKDADFEKWDHVFDYRTYIYDIASKWNAEEGTAWLIKSPWAQRTGQLFTLAGEVEKKIAAK